MTPRFFLHRAGAVRWTASASGLQLIALLAVLVSKSSVGSAFGQAPAGLTPVPRKGFEISRWAREPMLRSPVAMNFDDRGRLYVVETARRSTVDIDIRGHQSWIVADLANQSIDDLRRFFRAKMAPEASLENANWLRDYNGDGVHDWHDLTEVKEKVHLLEDTSGAGKADRARVFAEGFNEEVNGVIAGVMPWEDGVFVTVYPDLWRLQDTDGDGVADRKESWFRGFGVHAAFDGHDLHGLIVGPEGKIYFSHGDNGFSVTNREGRRLHYPNTGGVFRMNPDGSDLEVFATGLRNPQEIAFDDYGNLFSVDNDGDLGDERERFVYIAEGSDSGWRLHWQFREAGWGRFTRQPNYNPWMDERMWVPHHKGQPAHITPPLTNYSVGPGSIRYNPGTALNDSYKGHFFLIQYPVQKVTAFQARPKGASFEMVNEHVFLSGMMACSLAFSPDGALFVGDWDGMWEPSGRGSVWRLDDPLASQLPMRREVKGLLAEGMRGRELGELKRLLGHVDMRIRQRAQFELVRRGAREVLLQTARSPDAPQLARVHALWGLDQLHAGLGPEDLPFADSDAEIRVQSARVAGDLRLRSVGPTLIRMLRDDSARVRYHSAVALGKAGGREAVQPLVELLASNDEKDPLLRHAGVMGLTGIGDIGAVAALASHPSTSVRLAAVVVLRRLASASVTAFLKDADPDVRREAVRAIHDDSGIPDALPALAEWVGRADLPAEEAVIRRALNANLRLGTDAAAQRLAAFASDTKQAEAFRVEAIECLGSWNRTPSLDRVEGMVRPLSRRDPGLGDRMIRENLNGMLVGAGEMLSKALAGVVMDNRVAVDPAVFAAWVESPAQPPSVRAKALELLAAGSAAQSPKAVRLGLEQGPAELRMAALRIAVTNDVELFARVVAASVSSWGLRERQLATALAGRVPGTEMVPFLSRLLDDLVAGRLQPEMALDVVEACRGSAKPEFRERLETVVSRQPAGDPLAKHRLALSGGDPAAGREVFRNHSNAQCIRCHEAGGDGHQAGPVLAGIGKRVNSEYLLESLIDPSKRIAEGFATTSVVTRDGEVTDGIRMRETPEEVTLRLASGEVRKFAKKDVEKVMTSTVSAMPPMGEVLTPFELRDVLAYLASLK